MKHLKGFKLYEGYETEEYLKGDEEVDVPFNWNIFGSKNIGSLKKKSEFKVKVNIDEMKNYVKNDPELLDSWQIGNPDISDTLNSVERYLRSKII